MNSTEQAVQAYQLRIWIREISPQIWRRLLVRSDSTIAQLHDTLQIAFGWSAARCPSGFRLMPSRSAESSQP